MSHYVQCPFLLYLLVKIHPEDPPSPLPLTRLGLVEPAKTRLLSVACMFAGYHAVRRKCTWASADPLSDAAMRGQHLVFADAYIDAALECGLPSRAFSTFSRINYETPPASGDSPAPAPLGR